MMEHIIKSLADKELTLPIIMLGLAREARLWHKQVLEHKAELTKNKK
ncbi:hypothetical protein [Streptococcus moroccensis]|uniref:Uncharacterized protein n=1 Tax=Streptococcus moroccensis TaxID=1451356 RepID=A0ABT9YNY6_9STRE|nr:hypothetical protein [Streptococcus moroccensis]MDQ0221696.1 hypothetical protein [Streptococcus moroccensis]